MSELNVANRTLAIMDNLPFLRSINNECIDLIAIDPPFAANETFTQTPKPPITEDELAEEKALAKKHGVPHSEGIGETRVKDVWSWDDDIHPAWKMRIEDDYPAVHAVIQAVEACATENEAAYITFMAVRLIECHRALKPTGSIYVHCDSHANSYLRMLMNAVFGAGNFRNEIIWAYTGPSNTPRWFPRKHDAILFYVKSDNSRDARFNRDAVRIPYHEETLARRGRVEGERSIISPSVEISGRRNNTQVQAGFGEGKVPEDWWTDIATLTNQAERTGYPTQKPLALYERIIKASSNPGDIVLDIFAGCATTAVASERLERKWIACDMAYRSWTMLKRRFYQNGFALTNMTDSTPEALGEHQTEQQEAESYTIGPGNLPMRTDTDPAPFHPLAQTRRGRRSAQSASWSGRIPKDEAKQLLICRFGPVCWACGYEPRRPNGTIDDMLLEVDHIRAKKASEGKQGDDELYNLALLHRTCNGIKRNKLTLEELRSDNALNGRLYVSTMSELVDLFEAQQFAVEKILEHGAQSPARS